MKHVKNMDRTLDVVINELISNGHKINVVYDIGANDGRWTRDWMPKIKSSKHIMFEANPKEKCKVVNLGCTYFNQILSDENDKEVIYHLADKGKESTGNSYYNTISAACPAEYPIDAIAEEGTCIQFCLASQNHS